MTVADLEEALRRLEAVMADEEARAFAALTDDELEALDLVARASRWN